MDYPRDIDLVWLAVDEVGDQPDNLRRLAASITESVVGASRLKVS